MPTVFLRRDVVMKRVGLRASAFAALRRRDQTFPRPLFPFNDKTPVFVEEEVEQWQATQLAKRNPTNQ